MEYINNDNESSLAEGVFKRSPQNYKFSVYNNQKQRLVDTQTK